MATTIVTKSGSGAPTASDLVAGELAVDLTNKRLYTEDSGGTVLELGTNPSGNVTFGDNGKAIFGASGDLQIYHDGSHARLREITGEFRIQTTSSGVNALVAKQNAEVEITYAGATKLATTATGIDVTGSVTADGLTVDGDARVDGNVTIGRTTGSYIFTELDGGSERAGIHSSADNDLTFKVNNQITAINIDGTTRDISFYEDTGTTPKFYWDASAESLTITGNSNAWTIDNTTIYGNRAGGSIYVGNSSATGEFGITSGGVVAMQFDASGNVGIGTDSPDYTGFAETVLTIASTATNTQAMLEIVGDQSSSNSLVNGISFHNESSTATGKRIGQIWTERSNSDNDAGNLAFATSTVGGVLTEAMRIDASRNLLVGTLSTNPYTSATETGAVVRGDEGILGASRSGGASLRVNRVGTGGTENGDIAEFRSNGTTVGSIGASGGRLYIGSDDTSIFFDSGATPAIRPHGPADPDGVIDIGESGFRFKDLHLSGNINTSTVTVTDGVYIGGNGFANKLDDYEEGTWTPTMYAATTGTNRVTTIVNATYTKIGRLVRCKAYLSVVNGTALNGDSGAIQLGGLPFTATSYGHLRTLYSNLSSSSITGIVSGTVVGLRVGDSQSTLQPSNINTGTNNIMIDVTFEV